MAYLVHRLCKLVSSDNSRPGAIVRQRGTIQGREFSYALVPHATSSSLRLTVT